MGQRAPDQRSAAQQHHPAHRVPFALVGVEQRRGGVPAEHRGQLPAEVGGVLQPRVHALAARRGVDVRRVAGQEDAADPVGGGLPLVAVEAGHPARVVHAEVGAEGAADDLPDLLQADRVAVRPVVAPPPADHPVVAVTEGGDQREPVRPGVGGQRRTELLGELHVGQDQGADHRTPGERQPDQVADHAVRAVRAHHVRGPQHLPALVGRADLDLHPVGVLTQAGHLPLVGEVHPGLDGAPLQEPLHLVLRDDQDVREAGGQRAQVQGELPEEAEARQGAADRGQLVGEPAGVQLLQGPGVDHQGAGEVADPVRALLHEGDGDTGLGEVAGQQQSGGTGADDDHGAGRVVGGERGGAVHGGHGGPPVGRRPRCTR